MGIISSMERRGRLENPTVPLSSANLSDVLSGEMRSPAGITITQDRALGLTAFWAGVRVISQTIAGLPCKTYERTSNGRRLAEEHGVYKLLQVRPNPMMTPFTFREIRTAHCLTWGNSYAEIERDGSGSPIALWPLLPDRTGVELRDGQKVYWTTINGERIWLPADRVLHVPGLGYDGLQGYNVIKVHRDSLGLSIAANEYGSSFFGNSGRPSGILTHPGKPDKTDRDDLRDSWNQMHTGLSKAQRTAVLWGGMTWTPITLPPEDAQFLQTRDMQIDEIARILMINPIFLQHFSAVTTWGTGVVQFLTAFAKFTILPWLEREEDVLNYDLFREPERGKYYVKYLIEQLMRGDPKMQAEILEIKRRNGVVNADEWRQLEDENPLPNDLGKGYFMPMNMSPVNLIQNQPAEPPARSTREVRSSGMRDKMRDAHLSVFEDGVRRYVKRDVEALKKAVNSIMKKREDPTVALNRWIDEFYPTQERYIAQTMKPLVSSLSATVAAEAFDEVAADPVDINQFVDEYTANLARRESSSSIAQIRALIQEISEEDVSDALIQRADEWESTRPGKVSEDEVVRVSNGIARFAWAAVGVSYLVWRTSSKSCPLCAQMDGRKIGIKEYFLSPGESVTSQGSSPVVAKNNIGGPPLHAGCKCSINASL